MAGQWPIIHETNVVELFRILSPAQSRAQTTACLGDPELLRRQIPFVRADHISGMPFPTVFAEFRQVVALALHHLGGRIRILRVHIKSEHQQHVDQWTSAGHFSVLNNGRGPIDENVPVSVLRRPNIDTQLSRQQRGFIPCFRTARAVRLISCALLREGERPVPRRLVTVVHRSQQRIAAVNVLCVDQCEAQQTTGEKTSLK